MCWTRNFDCHADHSRVHGSRIVVKMNQPLSREISANSSGGTFLRLGTNSHAVRLLWIVINRDWWAPDAR